MIADTYSFGNGEKRLIASYCKTGQFPQTLLLEGGDEEERVRFAKDMYVE